MDAEKINFLRDVISAKWAVCYFFAAGSHNDGMKVVILPNAAGNQASPVNCHGIRCLATDDPEGWLVSKIPRNNSRLVGIAAGQHGGEIRLEPQHFRIGVRVSPMTPGNVPVCL